MLLRVLSDASFLSHPNTNSVAGGLSYLGLTDGDDWVNNPIYRHFTRILVVYSFVAEAERVRQPLRNHLHRYESTVDISSQIIL